MLSGLACVFDHRVWLSSCPWEVVDNDELRVFWDRSGTLDESRPDAFANLRMGELITSRGTFRTQSLLGAVDHEESGVRGVAFEGELVDRERPRYGRQRLGSLGAVVSIGHAAHDRREHLVEGGARFFLRRSGRGGSTICRCDFVFDLADVSL